jgi:type 1 fimbria pilin
MAAITALAHVPLTAGSYHIALGWANEPTYVGEQNAVQVLVSDGSGNAVTDLGPSDLQVIVSTAGQTSQPLSFEPAFDTDEGTGMPGDYRAPMIPTLPGDYTFHLTGSVDGNPIDATATSSDSTFDSVQDPTSIQFPNQVPSVTELATRIQSVDTRVDSAQSTAMLVGGAIGAVGIVIALIALFLAMRARRPRAA